jgi:hypothetical protein
VARASAGSTIIVVTSAAAMATNKNRAVIVHLVQSSSTFSRFTAGAVGFLDLSQPCEHGAVFIFDK